MGTVKAAVAMIQKMPDDCTWDDVCYLVYVRSKVERGLADVAASRVTPHEVVKAEVDQWLASIRREWRERPSGASA